MNLVLISAVSSLHQLDFSNHWTFFLLRLKTDVWTACFCRFSVRGYFSSAAESFPCPLTMHNTIHLETSNIVVILDTGTMNNIIVESYRVRLKVGDIIYKHKVIIKRKWPQLFKNLSFRRACFGITQPLGDRLIHSRKHHPFILHNKNVMFHCITLLVTFC